MRWLTGFLITLSLLATATAQQTKQTAATPVVTREAKAATGAVAASVSDCGCELPLPAVVAIVNGIKITAQDFSPEANRQAAQLREQVIAARRRELELQINSRLLDDEARRLKVSTYQLLKNQVVSKAVEPTDADALAFYNERKETIKSEFPLVKNEIVAFLREQRQRDLAGKFAEQLRAASSVQVLVPEANPPASAADRSRLFATVNGHRITSADIEDSLAPLIFNVQQRTYSIFKQDLDLKINDILLANEAQKRQVTSRALIETEIDRKVPAITEAQAQAFYDENKGRIKDDFAKVKNEIIEYLRDQEAQRLRVAFANRLRQAGALQVLLSPPVAPIVRISTDDQPIKGKPSAPIALVEFSDFQCVSCAKVQPTLDKLLAEYSDQVRLVVRDFPLNRHKNALKAAEAAEAARAQGKYWEYATLLYANQSALEPNQLKDYATRVGLDRVKFDAALDSGAYAEAVVRDLHEGDRAGVADTPAFFVNGRRVTDFSYDGLKAAIEAAITTAKRN